VLVPSRFPGGVATRVIAIALVAVAVLAGSAGVNDATSAFAEFSREMRVPFRNVRQAHPDLPADTLLYFVNPPVPGPDLAGMFFSHYGRSVLVSANDGDQPANLRDHNVAYVYTFDAEGNQVEQRVDRQDSVAATPTPPVTFAGTIRLEGFELANATVKQGQPVVTLLYWNAIKPVVSDYVVVVQIVDQQRLTIAHYEKEPRGGLAPTSTWVPGRRIVDAVTLSIPDKVAAGEYQLELSLYDPATKSSAPIADSTGQTRGEQFIIGPLRGAE
jgi:hypothetical protein